MRTLADKDNDKVVLNIREWRERGVVLPTPIMSSTTDPSSCPIPGKPSKAIREDADHFIDILRQQTWRAQNVCQFRCDFVIHLSSDQ
ncbi:hypothetical protein Trydic_g4247 [Trypoxylus dichotomus]